MTSPEKFVELCKYGSVQQVREAIQTGICIDAKNQNNRTALMAAAEENLDPEIINMLLQAGADVNAKDEDGNTSLILAATRNSNPKVVDTLIQAGADLSLIHI